MGHVVALPRRYIPQIEKSFGLNNNVRQLFPVFACVAFFTDEFVVALRPINRLFNVARGLLVSTQSKDLGVCADNNIGNAIMTSIVMTGSVSRQANRDPIVMCDYRDSD